MYNLFVETNVGILEIICDDNYLLEIKRAIYLKDDNPNDLCLSVKIELEEYFNKKRREFSVPIKFNGTTFEQRIYKKLIEIKFGETISYKELAYKIDNTKAVRAVANVVASNKILFVIPCHRVIGSDNSLTGYLLGIDNKIKLLQIENHTIIQNKNLKKSKIIKINEG